VLNLGAECCVLSAGWLPVAGYQLPESGNGNR